MKNLSFTLRQIASWTSEESEVQIPALQRGLVWKPRQVELLWDSILRGFPIGSFMLSDVVDKEESAKYYLMDGQQRYNAISIGYNSVKQARASLWIDLLPPDNKNATRKFWIKATTMPHPWGYRNDDEANRINTAEKREAIKKFGLKGNIYNDTFKLADTWPIEANLPIPLFCLLEAIEQSADEDSFIEKVKCNFQDTKFAYYNHFIEIFEQSYEANSYLRNTLYPAFKELQDYSVNCNIVPKEIIESETTEDSLGQTTLEVLFTRLNTGGTPISRDDLNYSAIKAYWPSIKKENDSLAGHYMNPAKLVMLAFRLALTEDNGKGFKNEMSIKQIRSAARKIDERAKIEALYGNNCLKSILEKVDEWLGITEEGDLRTPKILRTMIAQNSPDIYLLLMYLALKDKKSSIELSAKEIKALAFLIQWFGNDKKLCVQEIFRRLQKGINLQNIQKGIARLMHDCLLQHIYKPDEVRQFLSIGDSKGWRIWGNLPVPARHFFYRTFQYSSAEAREMLLYAERQYMNTHFRNYDPAMQDMWAEENRPWDFDHIVPQDWIGNKRGEYRDYDKDWLWSIGNMAAISFGENRSKSNESEYSEYRNNSDALCYLNAIENLNRDITYSKTQSQQFAQLTYDRYCLIYEKAYEVVAPLVNDCILSDTLQKRKDLIENIMQLLPEARPHFAAGDGKDYWIERDQDWAREWIGVGVVIGEFMVCFEWRGVIDNGTVNNAEIGIRKAPGTNVKRENQKLFNPDSAEYMELNDWWYRCDFDYQHLDAIEISEKMKKDVDELKQKLKIE